MPNNFLSLKEWIITGPRMFSSVRINPSFNSVSSVCDQYIPHRLNVVSKAKPNSLQQNCTILCIWYSVYAIVTFDSLAIVTDLIKAIMTGFSWALILPSCTFFHLSSLYCSDLVSVLCLLILLKLKKNVIEKHRTPPMDVCYYLEVFLVFPR